MSAPTLRELTKTLHHAAECHEVGGAMAAGNITEARWAAWCAALLPIHAVIDPYLNSELGRTKELVADMAAMRPTSTNSKALAFALSLHDIDSVLGSAYVFTGAHLMGGAVIAKNLAGRLPCAHLEWTNRRSVINIWQPLRLQAHLERQAKNAFQAVIDIMDEIIEAVPQ